MLELLGDELQWAERARCRGLDSDKFFVKGAAEARLAAKVCTRCDVRNDCLDYAVENEIDFGVWGGLTERQRRAYARRLGKNVAEEIDEDEDVFAAAAAV